MKQPIYTVIEDRQLLNGAYSPIVHHYDSDVTSTDPETGITRTLTPEDQAYAKYYAICSAAVVSVIPYHEARISRSDIGQLERRVWDRRTDEPEPTQDETPEEAPAEEEANETA